ncbi:MAG: hypothetical protein MUC77_17705, partial [Chromatiaceae bacterium]|nr:hypothetical protein [Chromatiaceae bacterium]
KNLFAITELKLKAQPFGIRKIEAGPAGGRILFGPEPKVDPARLARLIQTRPRDYKLDGGERLRFFRDLSDTAMRPQQVGAILAEVTGD